MSVGNDLNRAQINGDGSISPIAFNRKVFAATDIVGAKEVTATGVVTDLVQGTDYTVSGAGDTSTGVTITPLVAPAVGERWTFWSDQANTQNSVYTENDRFPAKTTEYALDKQSIGIQDQSRYNDLGIRFPDTEAVGTSGELPVVNDRKSKALGFDANGDISMISVSNVSSSNASAITYDPAGTGAVSRTVESKLREIVSLEDFGAVGDDTTDNETAIQNWLTHINSTGDIGYIPDGIFLSSSFASVSQSNPICIRGPGTIKATGSSRQKLLEIEDVTRPVDIDEITIDGNSICSRPIIIASQNVAEADLSEVTFRSGFEAKNAIDSDTAAGGYGVYVFGGFKKVFFDGTIRNITSSRAAGSGLTSGVEVALDSGGGSFDYTRLCVVGSNAKIIDVSNANSPSQDADGFKYRPLGVTNKDSVLVVEPGAYFENCQGRSIKSQSYWNTIVGASVYRSDYFGTVEIDCQYGGAIISGCNVTYAGDVCDRIFVATLSTDDDNPIFRVHDNNVRFIGAQANTCGYICSALAGSTETGLSGISLKGNNVVTNTDTNGEPDYFCDLRGARTEAMTPVGINSIAIKDNYCSEVGTAFVFLWRFGSGNVTFELDMTGNVVETSGTTAISQAAATFYRAQTFAENKNMDDDGAFTLSGSGAIQVGRPRVYLESLTGADATTLADGEEGDRMLIIHTVDGGASTLTPTNLRGGTTITFTNVDEYALIEFASGEWTFLAGDAVLA